MKHQLIFVVIFSVSTICNGYEFKGYKMGMSLSEFKEKGIHEDVYQSERYDRVYNWVFKLICSDENKEIYGPFLDRYPNDKLVICSVKEEGVSKHIPSTKYYKDSYFWLKISNGTYPIKPKFTFVSIKDSEEPVLTVIDFEMKSTNFKSLLETMKEKYKNPISSSRNNLQNSYGANFQNEEYFWKDKDSEIQLTKYSSNYSIENSSVYFYLTKGGEQLIRLRDEKKSQDKTKGF